MSISLNDHEQRIKDVELQLPDIENRINDIAQNACDIVKAVIPMTRNRWSFDGTVDVKYESYKLIPINVSTSFYYQHPIAGGQLQTEHCNNYIYTDDNFNISTTASVAAGETSGIKITKNGVNVSITNTNKFSNASYGKNVTLTALLISYIPA